MRKKFFALIASATLIIANVCMPLYQASANSISEKKLRLALTKNCSNLPIRFKTQKLRFIRTSYNLDQNPLAVYRLGSWEFLVLDEGGKILQILGEQRVRYFFDDYECEYPIFFNK